APPPAEPPLPPFAPSRGKGLPNWDDPSIPNPPGPPATLLLAKRLWSILSVPGFQIAPPLPDSPVEALMGATPVAPLPPMAEFSRKVHETAVRAPKLAMAPPRPAPLGLAGGPALPPVAEFCRNRDKLAFSTPRLRTAPPFPLMTGRPPPHP